MSVRNFNKTVNFADLHSSNMLVSQCDDSVASKGNSFNNMYESSNARKLLKKPSEFLDIEKVEKNRIRIERIKNVLETQFEKDKTNLERGLRTQVNGGTINSRALRNASLGIGHSESLKGPPSGFST